MSAVGPPTSYPARLEGQLDPTLSRWLWLVKWLLIIPHAIVLVFLWIAFVVLTIVAGFAILFTERYPRGIFDFTVGVLRWVWRVSFYSYAALGTGRYPPFTLGPVPDYPATLDIPYPERLSRWLVLVKWWLLAIPHYLLLAISLGGGPPGPPRRLLGRPDRAPRPLRRRRAPLHDALSAGDLRLRPGARPLGPSRRRLRRPHARRVPPIPTRPRRTRARKLGTPRYAPATGNYASITSLIPAALQGDRRIV